MANKMHICFICHEYPPCNHGGIGSFTKDLAEALQKKGYQVTILGYYLDTVLKLDTKIEEMINGIRVIRYPYENRFSSIPLNTLYFRYKLYMTLRKLYKESRIDIIESPGGSGWLPFGTPLDIPLVTRLHGGEVYTAFQLGKKISRLMKLLEKMQLKYSNQIVSVSKYTAETIFNVLNVKSDYTVIYNSVDNIMFQTNSQEVKVEHGTILFVGTIKKAKGVEELITAMNFVFKENKNAHLILAGKLTNVQKTISYEAYLRSLVDDIYQNRISFVGALDRESELVPLMKKAEICCFPSYVESFSLVPLEAMSLGKAVIFTKLTSGPEIIEDGISGLLCNPKDPKDIAQKILLLLEDDILRNKIAENGQKRVQENFTFEKFLDENISLYQRIKGKI
jgi:glycosyltransferase involved in cell wall biosynthesis